MAAFGQWLGLLQPLCDAIAELLWLTRQAGRSRREVAKGGVFMIGFDRDAPRTLQVWDLANAKELRKIKLDFGPQGFGQVSNVAYSPAGTTLAVADILGSITVWDLERSTPIQTIHSDGNELRQLAFTAVCGH